jgi:hypothetical protein
MREGDPDVTLNTLHGDLTDLRGETRAGFADVKGAIADLKATMITGFAGLPTRQQSEEMLHLLREGNRRNDERFTQLDVRIREQHLETQQALHALIEGQRLLLEGQRSLATSNDVKELSAEVRRFIDGFLRGRGDGEPA